jgi:hypothetical protein
MPATSKPGASADTALRPPDPPAGAGAASFGGDRAGALGLEVGRAVRRLGPLERARLIVRARAAGHPLRAVAGELGISAKQARRYERLAHHPAELQELVEARCLPMAHAQVLAEARVADPRAWSARVARHGWTARELRRAVMASRGQVFGGRKRAYVRREDNALRVYAFRISRSAPPAERQRVIRLLEGAIEFLRA